MDQNSRGARFAQVREAASRLMHLHYCDNDVEGVIASFAPSFSWFGAGEEQYAASRGEAAEFFRRFRGAIPKCDIWDEHYDVLEAAPDTYVCSGMMWVSTAPGTGMYLKVHQRMTFVFRWLDGRLQCSHIHCSNPYTELVEDELFPEKIGKQAYEYVQERLRKLEEETAQKSRQIEVVMASIPGGLKISRDDAEFSFAYVSHEAAALFGYTVEEFMAVTGGNATGLVYPPDLPRALQDCGEAFQDGGLEYATKYRVHCKDGSLKWILDSGKKSLTDQGEVLINSLYLDITRSELDAQESLRQKELLNSIYDTIPCGILRFIRNGDQYEIVSLNRAALRLLGYDSEQACREDWRNGTAGTVLEADRHILQGSYGHLHAVGDRWDVEYRVCWPHGDIHWLSGTCMVVASSGGRDVIQRVMFDVTESKHLQEQLDREQEMYRVAMESSSDVMYEYRLAEDLFVSYAPEAGQKGQDRVLRLELPHYQENLLDRDIVHPDDVQAVIDNICNGRAEIFEARLHSPGVPEGGPYRWFRVTGKLILRDGRPSRVVGTLRDIHEVKETLSASTEELHMNQSALQAISGVYMSIYYADLPADRYYGVRIPEVNRGLTVPRSGRIWEELGRYIERYVDAGDRMRMLRFCDPDFLRTQFRHIHDRVEIDFRHRSPRQPDGLWLRLEVHLLSLEDGLPKNAVIAFRNVNEERRRELEHLLEEENARRALEEAYDAANRANQAKSEFLSKMSHDIRTPMNAILGMAAIGERSLSDTAKISDCFSKIQLSGAHLLELINEVLDMSKIESGSVDLQENTFRIPGMVRDTVEMIRPDQERRGLRLNVDLDGLRHEAVCGDLVRIQQILLNLLSNAVKYTPEGGHISLSVREGLSTTSGVGCYEFAVADDGIGMSEAFLQKLFLPFERAEDSRISQIQGTGLGMAITQNLVHMMGGAIQVESRLDEGSTFTVTLYLKLAERAEESGRQQPEPPEDLPFRGKWRILLVEDNDLNREIARALLEMSGLGVEEAVDGRDALERFRASPPGYYHLVLMDIQMPVMDGYQSARAIRALDRPDAAVPIIALTANAFADDVRHAKEAGMNEHLAKPLELDQLLRVLKRWLR